jgi:hypothetical protein
MLLFRLYYLFKFFHCITASIPSLLWKYDLYDDRRIGNGGLRRGNGLVLSKSQEYLWISDWDGSLHKVSVKSNREHKLFKPIPRPNSYMESRSSVILIENASSTYAIYGIIDVSDTTNNNTTQR